MTRYEPDTPRRERAAKGTGVSHARGGVPHGDEILSNTALGGSADISPQNEVWPRNQICDFFLVVLGYLSLTDQERGFIFWRRFEASTRTCTATAVNHLQSPFLQTLSSLFTKLTRD